MAETDRRIPQIEDLEPQSVSHLDPSLEQVKVLERELHADETEFGDGAMDRLLGYLTAAGIETEQSMKQETSLPSGTLFTTKYAIVAKGKEQVRQVEDIGTRVEDENTLAERGFEARQRDIDRAEIDIRDALLDLTTVDTLHKSENGATKEHFFVVGDDGIYVLSGSGIYVMIGGFTHSLDPEKTAIDPATFGTDKFVTSYVAENSGDENGDSINVYVFRNPSKQVPVQVVALSGMKKHFRAIETGETDDTQEDETEAKLEDDGAENAYDRFSRKLGEFPVPQLDKLVLPSMPAQEDEFYFEALENGYRQVQEGYERLDKTHDKFHEEYESLVESILKSAGELRFKDKKERYAVEDLVISYKHNNIDYHTALKRSLKTARRVVDDFRDALTTDFITVEKLSDDEMHDETHFYIVKGDEVYEAHINAQDPSSINIEPHKSILGVEHFSGEALGRLRENAKGSKSNSYLVTSQTKALTPKDLYRHVAKVVASDAARILADGLKEEGGHDELVEALGGLSEKLR